MKIKTTIESITHDDLVELFSTALYGSDIFGVDYDAEVYNHCPDKKGNDCLEDKIARILLNGGSITISDLYADDENDFYGELRHEYDSSYRSILCRLHSGRSGSLQRSDKAGVQIHKRGLRQS